MTRERDNVIVYREARRAARTVEVLAEVACLLRGGDLAEVLVTLGELEQGVLDAIHEAADSWSEIDEWLRDTLLTAGRAYLAARRQSRIEEHILALRRLLEVGRQRELPSHITLCAPEGYVHYGLDPWAYARAAERFRRDVGVDAARRALVVGVRSIGTSLSAVVAATLDAEYTVTVRPRGCSGARKMIADERLRTRIGTILATGVDVLVVDEGPGATGETFDVVANWLREMGAADHGVVLFPSRSWGMALAPVDRQARFASRRKYAPEGVDRRPAAIAARLGLSDPQDLSAGLWRQADLGSGDLPADAVHERVKVRVVDERGDAYLIRYCGMGTWGRAIAQRARALAAQGLGPEVVADSDGFLVSRWVGGRPCTHQLGHSRSFLTALTTYVATRRPLFPVGDSPNPAPLVAMLRENAAEALGPRCRGVIEAARCLERLPQRPAVVADARLQPWEWLHTGDGYRKVDALDHGDGLRLPGPIDVAWDLAAAAVEHRLDDEAMQRLLHRVRAPGESSAELAEAVAAYRPPYAAFAFGQATLAGWEAPAAEDKRRLMRQAARYRLVLARELDRVACLSTSAPGAIKVPP